LVTTTAHCRTHRDCMRTFRLSVMAASRSCCIPSGHCPRAPLIVDQRLHC
jgi:hypothetical protein